MTGNLFYSSNAKLFLVNCTSVMCLDCCIPCDSASAATWKFYTIYRHKFSHGHNPLEIIHTTQVKLSSNLQNQDVRKATQNQILFSSIGNLC